MKNIIFDLDGTLIDSMPVWSGVGKSFLVENGTIPPENVDEIFKRMSFEESYKYFVEKLGLKCSFSFMLNSIIQKVKDCYANSVPLKPHVYEFLEKEFQKGTNMCILTASEKEYVLPALERPNDTAVFEDAFHGVVSAKKSGFYTVAVEDRSSLADRDSIIETADRYIKSFDELI